MKAVLFSLLILSSCLSRDEKGSLNFSDIKQVREEKKRKEREEERRRLEEIRRIEKLKKEKVISWNKIVSDAQVHYQRIEPLLKRKCYDCHYSKRKLPFYGKILKKYNPVYKHQFEGLQALDFVSNFPLVAKGNPEQISLLRSIRDVVLDRTMPLKSYTFFYPFRKLIGFDEARILNWVEPILEKIENHNEKYAEVIGNGSLETMAKNVLAQRCFRCHANGVAKGGFGDMQNLDELLLRKKYVNLERPDESFIYTISVSGQMPPSKRERLKDNELNIILDWLKAKSAEITNN